MKSFVLSFILAVALVLSVSALPAFSQDSQVQPASVAPVVAEEPAPAKELSVYGEVQSVNTGSSTISVQYYDYDSDEEKTADIVADKDAKIENVTGIDKINKGDWIDVIYVVKDAKNIAKSVIVEKEEPDIPATEKVTDENAAVE